MWIFCYSLNTTFLPLSYIFQVEALPSCSGCVWNGFIASFNVFRKLMMRVFLVFLHIFMFNMQSEDFFAPSPFCLFCHHFNFFHNLRRSIFFISDNFLYFLICVSFGGSLFQSVGFSIVILKLVWINLLLFSANY